MGQVVSHSSLRSTGPPPAAGTLPGRPSRDQGDAFPTGGITSTFLDAIVNTTRSVPLPMLPRPEHWGNPVGRSSPSAAVVSKTAAGGRFTGFRGVATRFGADAPQGRLRATSDDGSLGRGPRPESEGNTRMSGGDGERPSHSMVGSGDVTCQPFYQRMSWDGARGSRAGRPPLPPRTPLRVSGSGSTQPTSPGSQPSPSAATAAQGAPLGAAVASAAPGAVRSPAEGLGSPGQMNDFSGPLIKAMYSPTSPLYADPSQLPSLAEGGHPSGSPPVVAPAAVIGGLHGIPDRSVTSSLGGGRFDSMRNGNSRTPKNAYIAPESRQSNM